MSTEEKPKINCRVVIEQLASSCGDAALPCNQSAYSIGSVIVPTDTSWQQLEESLSNVVLTHFNDVAAGLRVRRLGRADSDDGAVGAAGAASTAAAGLGLSMNSVKYFSIGKCLC